MSEISNKSNALGGEVSLIDLAVIFVRRAWLFVGFLVLFAVSGVVFAMLATNQFEYVSLYQIAEVAPDKPVESPEKTIAILKSQKLLDLETAYKAENGVKLPFTVSFHNPENTGLVRIASESGRENAEDVGALHKSLLDYLNKRHGRLLEEVRKSLQTRIAAVEESIEALKGNDNNSQALATAIQKRIELESELASLSGPEIAVVGRESAERVSPNRKLIVLMALMVGIVVGTLAVYFAEFVSVVRETMRTSRSRQELS